MSDCGCNNNNNPQVVYYSTDTSTCVTGNSNCCVVVDTDCVQYTGPNLTLSGIETNSTLTEVITAFNSALGSITGADWSTFDYSCLSDISPILTAQNFAEVISTFVCTLRSDFDDFTEDQYATDIEGIQTSISQISEPGFESCEQVGIVDTDTYSQVITKLITAACNLYSLNDPSEANWNTVFATDPLPTTPVEAFNIIISWIGNLVNSSPEPILPTFNNQNSCLSITGTNDSLYNTVVAIRDKTCSLPTFDINDLPWTNCIANPNPSGGADITSALTLILSRLSETYGYRVVEFDSDFFTVDLSNPSDPCSGYVVTLNDGIPDKFVALDEDDTNPSYLLTKMLPGDNISFDTSTTPGSVIIDCTAEDVKVKASGADTEAGYLIDKVDGGETTDSALVINIGYNATDDTINLQPNIDYSLLWDSLVAMLEDDPDRLAVFCSLACGCQPCSTTTTTTTAAASRMVRMEASAAGANQDVALLMTQINPTATFFNSGPTTITNGTTLSTGYYTLTTADIPATGTIRIDNNEAVTVNYEVQVLDPLNSTVPGSTSQTGTIASGGSLIINPFVFGDEPLMRVVIEIST